MFRTLPPRKTAIDIVALTFSRFGHEATEALWIKHSVSNAARERKTGISFGRIHLPEQAIATNLGSADHKSRGRGFSPLIREWFRRRAMERLSTVSVTPASSSTRDYEKAQGGKSGNNYLAGEDQHLDADDDSRPYTTVDIFTLSYQQAYKDGCPVVSGSFGSPGTWSGDLLDQIISKLATTNVSVVNSAGNSGGFGITQIGCPSCDIHSISVASVENDYLPGVPLTLSEEIEGGLKELNILSSSPWLFNESMPVSKFWFTPGALQNPELPDDGCDLSAVDIPDLTDTIVVLFRASWHRRRTRCLWAGKFHFASLGRSNRYRTVRAGARVFII